jgi:hypothetical protein
VHGSWDIRAVRRAALLTPRRAGQALEYACASPARSRPNVPTDPWERGVGMWAPWTDGKRSPRVRRRPPNSAPCGKLVTVQTKRILVRGPVPARPGTGSKTPANPLLLSEVEQFEIGQRIAPPSRAVRFADDRYVARHPFSGRQPSGRHARERRCHRSGSTGRLSARARHGAHPRGLGSRRRPDPESADRLQELASTMHLRTPTILNII